MKKVDLLFNEYAESHQNASNKLIHWFCVPLIFFSILGFISLIPSPHFCANFYGCISIVSVLAILGITIFYVRLSWKLAVIILFITLILEYIIYQINISINRSWLVFIGILILSWLGQFYGHKIEGKKPSFLKDLQFLLIGPIWLLSYILKKINLKY